MCGEMKRSDLTCALARAYSCSGDVDEIRSGFMKVEKLVHDVGRAPTTSGHPAGHPAGQLVHDNVKGVHDRLSCPHCGRSFAVTRFDMHVRVCANALPFRESVKALDECGPAPMIGDEGAISSASCAESVHPVVRTICTLCGRHFANERLLTHRRVCALQTLPSFRAQVASVEAVENEEEVLLALTQRALSAERRLAEESVLRAEAEQRAELAEAASRSIEAAYGVLSDAFADSETRVSESRGRAEAAEQKAEEARRQAELAEAGAKSIEAAYDVMAEALADAEKKIEKLRAEQQHQQRDRRLAETRCSMALQ